MSNQAKHETNSTNSSIVSYGDHEVDLSAIPTKSLRALVTRGLAHFLGNEVSAKVIGEFRSRAVTQATTAKGTPLTKEERESIVKNLELDSDDEEYQNVKLTFQREAIKALYEGTVGDRAFGPKADPFEAACGTIVRTEVINVLRAHGLHTGKANPKEDQTWTFGTGDTAQVMSFADLQARHLAKHEARIHREAKAKLDAEARKVAQAKAAAEKVKSAGAVDLEAFGF
jgi:hypothetical protein